MRAVQKMTDLLIAHAKEILIIGLRLFVANFQLTVSISKEVGEINTTLLKNLVLKRAIIVI